MNWRNLVDLLVAHRSEILLILAGVASFSWQWLKTTAIALMLQAEKMAREEMLAGGPEKLAFVMDGFNHKYFDGRVPDAVIRILAQRWYNEAIGK